MKIVIVPDAFCAEARIVKRARPCFQNFPWTPCSETLDRLANLMQLHKSNINVHMRTTLTIDGDLLREAGKLTGIEEKTALVRMELKALIEKESARRHAEVEGSVI